MEGVSATVDKHQANKPSFWSLTEDNYAWFNKSSFGYFFIIVNYTIMVQSFFIALGNMNYIYNLGDCVENASGSQYGLGLSANNTA